MNKGFKFLGLCILLSSIIFCITLLVNSYFINRYICNYEKGASPLIFDKVTGSYYYYSNNIFNNVNPVKKNKK
jgi:hypothetical protein